MVFLLKFFIIFALEKISASDFLVLSTSIMHSYNSRLKGSSSSMFGKLVTAFSNF